MKITSRVAATSIIIFSAIQNLYSQTIEKEYGIKFSGYVKTDIFYDTRQSSASNALREGFLYMYPDNVLYDADMKDINANPSFHILNIQTRLRGDITGPDAFGAKTSGVIEGEFFGTSEADVNGFRLRHAYVKLDWAKTGFIMGQYWHPMFPSENFPGTISFNTGIPFNPFSRNPQVRLSRILGPLSLTFSAYGQRDFTTNGPEGFSNKYQRNSGMPGTDLQIRVLAGDAITYWAGVDYKRIKPELKTVANAETDVMLGSFSAYTSLKIITRPINISIMGLYAQNGSDLLMLGGYGVSEITDAEKQFRSYTNISVANVWLDLSTKGKLVFGLFTGFSKNLGSQENIIGSVYGRGTNIDYLFRISPRASITEGRLTFAAEVENTTAAYGTMQANGKVTDTNNVNNIRFLLSSIYKF